MLLLWFILIVYVRLLSVCLWLTVQFIEDSLVAIFSAFLSCLGTIKCVTFQRPTCRCTGLKVSIFRISLLIQKFRSQSSIKFRLVQGFMPTPVTSNFQHDLKKQTCPEKGQTLVFSDTKGHINPMWIGQGRNSNLSSCLSCISTNFVKICLNILSFWHSLIQPFSTVKVNNSEMKGPRWRNISCCRLYVCSVYLKEWWQSDPKWMSYTVINHFPLIL